MNKRQKAKRKTVPIMSLAAERFMAFEGLLEWTSAVIIQAERIADAHKQHRDALKGHDQNLLHLANLQVHTECHFFATAAYNLVEHRKWVVGHGLCKNVDFSALDQFSEKDIRDLRDMRVHQIDYFKGRGRVRERWTKKTPNYKADASSLVGTLIGGRLDWVLFSQAARSLLPVLLKEPAPYPC
jgi:hypothetical protein